MSRFDIAAIAAMTAILTLGPSGAHAQPGDPGSLENRVQELMRTYESADAVDVASFYAPDAVVLTGGNLLKGAEQISAALAHHFAQLESQTFELDILETHALGAEHGVTSAVGTTRGRNASGEVIFAGTISVSIHWRRGPGGWSIVYTQEDFRPSL